MGGSYVIISRCHACSWGNWQKDSVDPLTGAGFQSVIGTFNGGKVLPDANPEWITDIAVGPFSSDADARAAMQRSAAILKPIGIAHWGTVGPEEVNDKEGKISTGGYDLRIAR